MTTSEQPNTAPEHPGTLAQSLAALGMPPELGSCMARSVLMAARSLTRVYNEALATTGLQVTQLSVLLVIRLDRAETLSQLADQMALERTSLLRNLDVLRRRGLIRPVAGRGRAKRFAVTPAGEAVLAQALPLWRVAQQGVLQALGDDAVETVRSSLRQLRKAADTVARQAASTPSPGPEDQPR